MLFLFALKRIPETSASWMQDRPGKGASILPRARAGWGKTLLSRTSRQNRKDRDGWEALSIGDFRLQLKTGAGPLQSKIGDRQ